MYSVPVLTSLLLQAYELRTVSLLSADSELDGPGIETRDINAGGILKIHVSSIQTASEYTGCPRRNVPDFGSVFLMLKYTDITQNTYIQS